MGNLNEAMLTQKEAIQKIKNGFTDDLSPLVSCYNWVGIIIAKNQGKLGNTVVALYGLPGTNKIAHAAIEHPNGKLISEERAPKGLRNAQGFVDRPDMERHVIPMDKMERLLQESADRYVDSIFGYHNPNVSPLLTESDVRVDELFGSGDSYEFASDQGDDYCDYQFIVPGPTGNDDPERYVIDCRFKRDFDNKKLWSVEFSDSNGIKANTKNNGKQFAILNTIVSIVKDFLTRNHGVYLVFTGEMGSGKKLQGQIYSAMLRKLAGEVRSFGYKSAEFNLSNKKMFELKPIEEQANPSRVDELMSSNDILPYTDHGDTYTFEANGQTYRVYDIYNEFFFEVGEEGSVEPTNLNNGTQFRIISTAFAIMKKIVEKKSDVTSWHFSGEIKDDGQRVSGLGRMYHMICKRDFTPWMVNRGFVAYHDLSGSDSYSFIYTLLKEFEEILHDDPSSLAHVDINQLYGYNKAAFKTAQQTG